MAYSALRTLVNRAGITFDALKTHVVFAEDMNQIKDNIEYLESNRSALSTILNFANLGSGYLMRWDGSKLVNSKVYNNGTNVGIGTTSPLASLHVGNNNTNNSSDSVILISRLVNDTGAGSGANGHAFSDSSTITRGGTIGYNSFDGRTIISGTNNYNHYAVFQNGATYSSSGTMGIMYGFVNVPVITAGTITNMYGIYTANPTKSGGTIANNYGLYTSNQTSGNNNWGMYIDMSGTATNIPLEIKQTGTGNVNQILLNRNSGGVGDQNSIKWKASTLEMAEIAAELRSGTTGDLVFKTNNTGTTNLSERMRITSGGNVGIGQTAPGEKLSVLGHLLVGDDTWTKRTVTGGDVAIQGNVGIGTTNPLGSLHVANTSNNYVYLDSVAGGYNQLFFRDATTLKYQFGKLNDNTFGLYNSAAGVYSILTDASSNINLNAGQVYVQKSSGNVGIATSNPTAKADINSDILRLRTAKTPATAGAAGNQGDMCWDSGFLYICVSTNAWVRSALATW